jgi:toxin ParE1/3/4
VKEFVRPAARDDILRQFRYYLLDREAPETAARFLAAVEASVEQLLTNPEIGSPRQLRNPNLAGLRAWPVLGFETIRVYYLVQGKALRIVRVLHGKRDLRRILEADSTAD